MNIFDKKILILSTPRSGSNLLFYYLKENNNKIQNFFIEPELETTKIKEFENLIITQDNFLIKTHFKSFNSFFFDPKILYYLSTSDEIFRIRLQRNNLIKQIKSLYIALHRKKWHYYNDEIFTEDSIDIDENKIKRIIYAIVKYNQELTYATVKFDLDLKYENLPEYILNNNKINKTPLSNNDQELENIISFLYSDYINYLNS